MAYICIYFHIPTTSCGPGYTARQYKGLRMKRAVSTSEDRINCGPFNRPGIHWDSTTRVWWGFSLLCTPQTGPGDQVRAHIRYWATQRHDMRTTAAPWGKEAGGKAHAACWILLQGGGLRGWRIRMRDEASLLGEGGTVPNRKQLSFQTPGPW